ncbi:MAG: 2-octaprenyl-6-methoxyphenyl hydroxylase [Arenicellales bacterium]
MPEHIHTTQFDIVIIGGGLAGASLAVALAGTAYKVAVIEPFEFDASAQPSYDERTIALTYSAKHIFTQIGVWDEPLEQSACALKSIHISNKGHFGITNLSHKDVGMPALGYVIPTRAIGQSLMKAMQSAENVSFFCPFEAQQVNVESDTAHIQIKATDGAPQTLSAKLVVIADGGRSSILKDLGFNLETKPYAQSALLSIVSSNLPHKNNAFERFVNDGPLALLPMNDQRYAVVWTLSPDDLNRISALSDDDYITELQSTFGMRAGILSLPTPRKSYPLSKNILNRCYQPNILALGNAAHTVHPVAGQGFNLGLRDVAALVEVLSAEDNTKNIGSEAFLKAYSEQRESDTKRVGQFTDGLLKVFASDSALIKLGRNVGLSAIEKLPFIKRALLKRTMGISQHQPRLARGLKIR